MVRLRFPKRSAGVAFAFAAAVLALAVAAWASPGGTSRAAATLKGTAGPDVLRGTSGNDILEGLDGALDVMQIAVAGVAVGDQTGLGFLAAAGKDAEPAALPGT